MIINDVNNRVYIGYTSKSLIWRLRKHFEETDMNTSPSRKIHRAMKEIGHEHFEIKLLYESDVKGDVLGEKEQYYIEKFNAITEGYNCRKGGGGAHLTEGQCKKVDLYNSEGELVQTFPSRVAAADFIGCAPGIITTAITNADKGKGSQVHGYWVCHHGCKPGYKVPNTKPGCNAARRRNLGRKRPEHSQMMKARMNDIHTNYHTPSGTYTLVEGAKIWGRDMLIAWCNNPEQVITKMMISKSKKLNLSDHGSWIGKTKRAVGFWRPPLSTCLQDCQRLHSGDDQKNDTQVSSLP